MQTLTFTQKLLRQRRFLSSLLSLFAIFLGLGNAQAQTATQTSITTSTAVFSMNGGANATYNGKPNTPTQLDGAYLGSFDINTGQLTLKGGTVTTNESGTSQINAVTLNYQVYDPSFNNVLASGTITLPTTGGTNGGARTFSTTSAAVNLVNLVSGAGGTAATGYNLEISYSSTFRINGAGPNRTGATDGAYYSTFDITGTIPPPNGATITNPTVIVDQGNGSVTYTAATFNGQVLADQKPGSTTTPAFDINTGQLVLKGGTLTTNETGASTVNGAFLDYIIYAPNYTSTITTGTLQLTQTSGPDASGNRTFSLTTGTTNLIGLVPNAANNYVVSISYHATYQNNGMGAPVRVDNNGTGSGYNATFSVTGTRFPAPTVSASTISIAPNGNADVVYNINPSTPRPFQGADLSSASNGGTGYDVNNGQLRLNSTTVNTNEAGTNIISSVVLYYRTRLNGTSGGAFQPITLTQASGSNGGPKTFVLDPNQGGNNNPQPNLIATPAVTAAGNYLLDVYYQANGYNSSTNATFTVTDPPTGAYTASFTVTGVPIATTIWTGGKNDNWFDNANWSNGVPTATTNALVRDLGAGIAVPYPNINSDTRVTTANGTLLYDNTGSGPAMTFNLTMGGSSQAARSITRLVAGQLKVYGDFNNVYDSFIQREGTIMEFAGGNQAITGGSFVRVDISGGGTKSNGGTMTIAESLNFLTPNVYTDAINPLVVNPYTTLSANAGILSTDISRPTVSLVTLADRAPTNFNNGAQLNGETDPSFLYGFVRTTRQTVLVGETRTYGNIGLTITFNGTNAPGNVDVTRNTVEAYSPINSKYGIRRIFGVRPSDPQTNTGGLTATLVFHYRDAETMNLGGPTTRTPGTQSIAESNLVLFVSTNSGNTFGFLGRDVAVDETNNLVTKSGVTTFATFTLGDKTNPLPVRLTAFDAKRIGTDALVTWQTASEVNSKGYDVQVSTNGTEFRTLTSVPSAAPNSVRVTDYRYVDTEANKSGVRYYRLRQVDLDGKEAFFAPVSVSFEGKAAAATVVAYPNPFTVGEELKLDVQSAAGGKGQLRITDMTGRTIRQEAIDVTSGITSLSVSNFGELKSGVYLVRVSLPSGETKNLKVVKQ